MDNREVARVFSAISDLLAVRRDSPFKIRAYSAAAEVIRDYPVELRDMLARGEPLQDIPGVGVAIARKTEELLRTGRLEYFEKLKAESPPGVLDLMQVPGIGPRTASLLAGELGITSVDELDSALHGVGLPGIGVARRESLMKGIAEYRRRALSTLRPMDES